PSQTIRSGSFATMSRRASPPAGFRRQAPTATRKVWSDVPDVGAGGSVGMGASVWIGPGVPGHENPATQRVGSTCAGVSVGTAELQPVMTRTRMAATARRIELSGDVVAGHDSRERG